MDTTQEGRLGFGIGDKPPAISLPDLFEGDLVTSDEFIGKRTVFFVWASW